MAKDSRYLDEELNTYSDSGVYPFHMPGHKRMLGGDIIPDRIDITEIDGFDNLHHAEGILKEASDRLARLYGAKRSFLLVNGSTCGILSAISAATRHGDKILVARNSHKAVYHAVYLGELSCSYLYPQSTKSGIQGSINPADVESALANDSEIKAVVITSPTYDGVISDIEGIAKIAHKYNIPLIVDSAHGAHFAFGKHFPEDALHLGADAVIESIHKTLPAFTQTAVLNVPEGSLIDEARLERYTRIYQSSSPSYVLMSSVDRCSRILANEGDALFEKFEDNLQNFYKGCQDLKNISVEIEADPAIFGRDDSKILIRSRVSGQEIYDRLLAEYKIQLEMAASSYCTALTSVMDSVEGFDRLSRALHEIDAKLELSDSDASNVVDAAGIYVPMSKAMEIFEAMDAEYEEIALEESAGCISTEFVFLYPPGIPIVAPGEIITDKTVADIKMCRTFNMAVEGMQDKQSKVIRVVKQ